MTEVRTRTRPVADPPETAIPVFTRLDPLLRKALRPAVAADRPEGRPGFLGRIARAGTGPAYRAWGWTGEGYQDAGVHSDCGEAQDALRRLHIKTAKKSKKSGA